MSIISIHYVIYCSIYFIQLTPCLGNPMFYSVQKLFSGWYGTFILMYIWEYLGLLVAYIVIIYFVFFLKKKEIQSYIWILLLLLYIGGLGSRALGGFFKGNDYQIMVSLFGVCGELL